MKVSNPRSVGGISFFAGKNAAPQKFFVTNRISAGFSRCRDVRRISLGAAYSEIARQS
jgi:hypothetical protein